MYEYEIISSEARERARRREHEAERERIAREARASSPLRRLRLPSYLRLHRGDALAREA